MAKALDKTACFGPKMNRTKINIPQAVKESLFDEFLERSSNSSIGLHIDGRKDIDKNDFNLNQDAPPYIKELFAHVRKSVFLDSIDINIEIPNDCCSSVLTELENNNLVEAACCKQGSVLWKDKQQHRITGTSCYSIFTYKGPNWKKKSKSTFMPSQYVSKEMKFGLEQESHALNSFQTNNPACVVGTIGIFISERLPWLGCSPDGIIFENQKPTRLLEIKCLYAGKFQSAVDVLPTLGYLEKDHSLKKRHKYYGQIQFSMALLILEICKFIVYFAMEDSYLQLLETVTENYFYNMVHNVCLIKADTFLTSSEDE